MTDSAVLAMRLGGALHFVQLPAMIGLLFAARRLHLTAHVPPALMRILVVLGGGIVLAVASGGALALLMEPCTLPTRPGLVFAGSWAVFWSYRLLAQVFVYGPVIPKRAKAVHWLLVFVFLVKSSAYAYAAIVASTYGGAQ